MTIDNKQTKKSEVRTIHAKQKCLGQESNPWLTPTAAYNKDWPSSWVRVRSPVGNEQSAAPSTGGMSIEKVYSCRVQYRTHVFFENVNNSLAYRIYIKIRYYKVHYTVQNHVVFSPVHAMLQAGRSRFRDPMRWINFFQFKQSLRSH
jgi:hypothetical protein